MKSIFRLLLIVLACYPLYAQQTTESSSNRSSNSVILKRDLTITDINGESYNLQDYLDQDKCILIDFAGFACGPCYGIHASGILERLQEQFGPNGTNQLQVFWCEVNGASMAAIKGDWQTGSKGNWTVNADTGEPVNYPLISNPYLHYTITGESFESLPHFLFISPNGEWFYPEVATIWNRDQSQVIKNVQGFIDNRGQLDSDKPNAVATVAQPSPLVLVVQTHDHWTVRALEAADVHLYNASGVLIYQTSLDALQTDRLPLGTIQPGAMLVVASNGLRRQTIKIIR